MLTRLVRWQLAIFGVVTAISVTLISLFYLKIPDALGIGSYEVTANFAATGGLYQNANVTYRGTTIGRVTDVALARGGGVDATLRLDSDTTGARRRHRDGQERLGHRRTIRRTHPHLRRIVPRRCTTVHASARDHTALSQDVAGMLKEAEKLVDSLSESRLRDLLRETFKAFDGSGPDLARLIESSRLLVDEANSHAPETTALIDQAGPFLDAQIRSGDDIKSLADGLARFTGDVRQRRSSAAHSAADRARCRRRRPAPPSPGSASRSRCWRPTSPTSDASASSTTSPSSKPSSSSPP